MLNNAEAQNEQKSMLIFSLKTRISKSQRGMRTRKRTLREWQMKNFGKWSMSGTSRN